MSHPPVSFRTHFMAAAAALLLAALPVLAQTQAAAKPAAVASKNASSVMPRPYATWQLQLHGV